MTLNLTWCPVISQVQTVRALDEMLDMVPLNMGNTDLPESYPE